MQSFVVHLEDDEVEYLEQLCGEDTVGSFQSVTEVVWWLAHSAADGIRRPGSWERGWVLQAFGEIFPPNRSTGPGPGGL